MLILIVYPNVIGGEVGAHYFKFTLLIATGWALLGCVLGVLAGRSLTGVYQDYYTFPFLVFQVDPQAFLIGVAVSVLADCANDPRPPVP